MVSRKVDAHIPHISGSHRMTWRELVEADDYATSIIVDPFLGFKTHKMTGYASFTHLLPFRMCLRIKPRVMERLKNIIIGFQRHKDYLLAYKQLINEDVNIEPHWKDDPRFRDHVIGFALLDLFVVFSLPLTV